MLQHYIEIIKPHIIKLFKSDSTGHDISHLVRTMNIAVNLCEKENGDRLIVGISAFMHDIHRIMQNELGHFVYPRESLDTVREILAYTDLEEEQINKICYCIEHHEEYNWNGNNVDDLNTLILQDADNLDAIGAIGIARTFTYGATHNIPFYDEEIPLNTENNFKENKNSVSSIHHFHHKLFKLKENMNTDTAKKIAIERTEFMEKYVCEFMEEWNGNK